MITPPSLWTVASGLGVSCTPQAALRVSTAAWFRHSKYADGDVPSVIKLAIMMYGALLYDNRGDCSECECDGDGTATIPGIIRAAISKYKIRETFG